MRVALKNKKGLYFSSINLYLKFQSSFVISNLNSKILHFYSNLFIYCLHFSQSSDALETDLKDNAVYPKKKPRGIVPVPDLPNHPPAPSQEDDDDEIRHDFCTNMSTLPNMPVTFEMELEDDVDPPAEGQLVLLNSFQADEPIPDFQRQSKDDHEAEAERVAEEKRKAAKGKQKVNHDLQTTCRNMLESIKLYNASKVSFIHVVMLSKF